MHCQECGTLISENAKFCVNCGARVSAVREKLSKDAKAAPTQKVSPLYTLVGTLTALVLIVSLFVYWGSGSSPSSGNSAAGPSPAPTTTAQAAQESASRSQQTIPITNASGDLSPAFIDQIEPNVAEINCYSYDDSIESSGSGVSFEYVPTGSNVIYTNYHVYAEAIVNGQAPTCFAVFPQAPDFTYNANSGDYDLSLTYSEYDPSVYKDAAIFTIESPIPTTKPLDHIPIIQDAYKAFGIKKGMCVDQNVNVGDGVTIFGYPNSGNLLGVSETVTTGIISGILPGPIYKTDAPIDHGNSGGYAILNKVGCGLGIPTLGEGGLTAGIGYIQSYVFIGSN